MPTVDQDEIVTAKLIPGYRPPAAWKTRLGILIAVGLLLAFANAASKDVDPVVQQLKAINSSVSLVALVWLYKFVRHG